MTQNISSGWTEIALGKVIILIGWGTPKTTIKEYWDGNIPWLSVSDFNNESRWVSKTEKTITELWLAESSTKLLEAGDLIISARWTVGVLAQLKREMTFNQSCYWIRNIDKISDINFLYYLIRFEVKQISRNVHGAVFDTITRETFDSIKITLPPLPEQRAIGDMLSSFDDKIELLREQNKTLESIGQLLFNEWFLGSDAIPKQRLGDLVVVKRGWSPRPIQDYISETGLRWLKISDASATESPFIFNIKEHIREEWLKKTTLLKAGSLVLSNSATPWIPKILAVDSCIHDGWLHFPKSTFSNEFLYLLFQAIRPHLIQQGSGSVFTNLKTDILKDFQAPLPDDKMLLDFDGLIKPIFKKIFDNAFQIQSLSQTRDELLPRLMSGEVRLV